MYGANPTNYTPGFAASAPYNYVKSGNIPGLVTNTNRGCIQYDEAPHPSTNQSLLKYIDHNTAANIQGQSLNVLPPQNLVNSETDVNLTGHDLIVFKAYLRHALFNNDTGSPPGDCPAFKQAAGGAWTSVDGRRLKIHSTRTDATGRNADQPGVRDGAIVTSGRHAIELLEVQPEGKAAMTVSAWLNGVKPGGAERFE